MRIPILMPQLGESIAEATIVRLEVAPGAVVQADQEIMEVETQKATMSVTIPCSGTVAELHCRIGDSYPVGATLGFLNVTADEAARAAWCRTWIDRGFEAIEKRLASSPGQLCYGDTPTLADICLVPQMFNARRYGVDLTRYPLMARTDAALAEIDAFQQALPSRQPDAE